MFLLLPQDEVKAEVWSKGPADRSGLKLAYDFSPDALTRDDGPMMVRHCLGKFRQCYPCATK